MDRNQFDDCLGDFHLPLRKFVVKKVTSLQPPPSAPATTIDELIEAIEIEWAQIDYTPMDPVLLRRACFRKAYDVWATYCRQLKKHKAFLEHLTIQVLQKQANQPYSSLESANLWNYLRKHLTPTQENLFTSIVLNGYSFKRLGKLLGKKPATISRQYYRIRKKLQKLLTEEELVSINK